VIAKKVLADATILDETPVPENGVSARLVELGGIPAESPEADVVPSVASVQNNASKEYHAEDATVIAGLDQQYPLQQTWQQAIDEAMKEGDSLGAVIECTVPEIDPGYGEPFWDSVESVLAHGIFSIPGVRGIEFGDGFKAAAMKGSEHNDPIGEDGRPVKNGAGGVNGGITNGAPIVFRAAFKPTSSIRKAQQTFNFATGKMDTLAVPGRHDVCFALRAPVVVEAVTAITLADLILTSRQ
jgi:chorismate synthase